LVQTFSREWVVELSMLALFSAALLSSNLHAVALWQSSLPADEVATLLEWILEH
jgi:hypothetical protein